MKVEKQGSTVSVHELSPAQQAKLEALTTNAREKIKKASAYFFEECIRHKVLNPALEVQYVCSCCGSKLPGIERRLFGFFRSKHLGYYCSNPSCEFNHKFIPAAKSGQLVLASQAFDIASIPEAALYGVLISLATKEPDMWEIQCAECSYRISLRQLLEANRESMEPVTGVCDLLRQAHYPYHMNRWFLKPTQASVGG